MLRASMLYIPARDRPDYEPPNGYIAVNCQHNVHSNFLDTLSFLMHRHVETHGPFDNNKPPKLVPQLPPPLGRRVPNFVRTANNKHAGACLCERYRPSQRNTHNLKTPPSANGRTRHFYTTDPKVVEAMFPGLSALARLPHTHIPNDPIRVGDRRDLLDRTLAKFEEWSIAVAPGRKRAYMDWILPFTKEAEAILATRRYPSARRVDTLKEGWEEELAHAYSQGLVIAKPDKLKTFAFMCSHLPHTMLKEFMENPDRYVEVNETPKSIKRKNYLAFKRIGCTTSQYDRLASAVPTMKTHKAKKDTTHARNENKLRPATSYDERGNAYQQKDLARILRVIERYHCGGMDSHVVSSSVDFHLKRRQRVSEHATADMTGMYDSLNLDYAAKAIRQLTRECFDNARETHGVHAHLVIADNGTVDWASSRPNKRQPHVYDEDKIYHLLRYLLTHDYVTAYGRVFRSTNGCPMGGNASGIICSLTAFFAERRPLREMKRAHPRAQMFRYADDAYFTISTWLFRLYFTGAYRAAGFELEFEEAEGETSAVNFLESTIHMRPTMSLVAPAATHYCRRDELADTERIYPERFGASSTRSQRGQVHSYARRVYLNTTSPRVFIEKLVRSHHKHPEYSTREIAAAARKVLLGTKRNRFLISHQHIIHLSQCIQRKHTAYHRQIPHTHFLQHYT